MKRKLKRLRNNEGSIPFRSLRSLSATPFHRTRPWSRRPACLCGFPRVFHQCFVDLIAPFFDLQWRIRNEASNDRRVWRRPATTADRISLRGVAGDRNADGRVSLRSAPATTTACGRRASIRQHSDSAATGWRIVVWERPAACTIYWRVVWKHDDPTAARPRWTSVREHHNSTDSGWRTLWWTTALSTTARGVVFWRRATTGPAAGKLSLWEHPTTRHRTDVISLWNDTTATCHWDSTVW